MTISRLTILKFVQGIVGWQCFYLTDIISISTLVNISVVMCKDLKRDQGPVVLYARVNL